MSPVTELTSAPKTSIRLPSGRSIELNTGLFYAGRFHVARNSATIHSVNPATGKVTCAVSAGDKEDVDAAVQAARDAFKLRWGRESTPAQRQTCLLRFADLIDKHADELAELESIDNGKPVWMAKQVDIKDSAACFRYFAGLADKVEGKTIEQQEGARFAFTRSEAIGVCGQIIPWNYPIQMFAWKVAPALAAGNTVVLKPAETTPLSALRLAELSLLAGFPDGVLNIVNGFGATVGQPLAAHMDVDKLAFTGSTSTGRRIMAAAASSNLKKVSLELGGKSPVVVFADADVEQAAHWVSMGILFNMGQDCTAGSRLLVEESIHDAFVARLVHNFQSHVIGDPASEKTFQGPQVSKEQYEKILAYIEAGKREGACVATGGEALHLPGELANGFFVQPTIFTHCSKGMKIVDEEIFGPVLAVSSFKGEKEAISMANDTVYGLGAGVFSKDADRCMRMVHALHAGTVWCNNYLTLSNAVPFGGMKQSGFGRELGIEGLKEYTATKSVNWNYGEKISWPMDGRSSDS